MKKNKVLRVGFDLDGVLLYNPARVVRMPITMLKRLTKKRRNTNFIVPTSPIAKKIWHLAHWTSLFTAPGYKEAIELIEAGKIDAYLVSARYEFLKDDFDRWIRKLDAKKTFSGVYMNMNDEQPHLFKERMIKELKLDVFIEDNFDIVEHLRKKKITVFWIYNILDRKIEHPYKFANLKAAIERLKKLL